MSPFPTSPISDIRLLAITLLLQLAAPLGIAVSAWLYDGVVIVRSGFSERQLPAILGVVACTSSAFIGDALMKDHPSWRLAWLLWGMCLLATGFVVAFKGQNYLPGYLSGGPALFSFLIPGMAATVPALSHGVQSIGARFRRPN